LEEEDEDEEEEEDGEDEEEEGDGLYKENSVELINEGYFIPGF